MPINGDAPAGQRRHINAAPLRKNIDVDAVVEQAFALNARADAALDQEVDSSVLQDSRANAFDDVVLGAILDNDGVDSRQMQQVAQHQSGRAGPDNSHLSAHRFHLLMAAPCRACIRSAHLSCYSSRSRPDGTS